MYSIIIAAILISTAIYLGCLEIRKSINSISITVKTEIVTNEHPIRIEFDDLFLRSKISKSIGIQSAIEKHLSTISKHLKPEDKEEGKPS